MLVTGCLTGKDRGCSRVGPWLCVPGFRRVCLCLYKLPLLARRTDRVCPVCSFSWPLGVLETLSPRCRGVGSPQGGERFPLMVVLYRTHGKIQVHFARFSCGNSHYQIENVSFCSHVYLFCSHAAVTARASLWWV